MLKKLLGLFYTLFPTHAVAQSDGASAILKVGTPLVVESSAADGTNRVVFEDDGETGYFYALDLTEDLPIQEAISIYNADQVADRAQPSKLKIIWSSDHRKAGLWINDYPHAIFDFSAKRGYSRSNFPLPQKWKTHDFSWDDTALKFFG